MKLTCLVIHDLTGVILDFGWAGRLRPRTPGPVPSSEDKSHIASHVSLLLKRDNIFIAGAALMKSDGTCLATHDLRHSSIE